MVFDALFPVFFLIALGWGLRLALFRNASFWEGAEKLTYYVFFPCLLFLTLARSPANPFTAAGMSLTLLIGVGATAVAAYVLRPLAGGDGPAFTSVFQGSIRPNTYVGLAAAAGLGGPAVLSSGAVALAVLVPAVNVLSVLTLARHGSQRGGLGYLWGQLLGNPLILACLAGIAANIYGWLPPSAGVRALEALGRAALPLGLLTVGAGLRFEAAGKVRGVAVSSLLKLCFFPALAWGLTGLMGVSGAERAAVLIFTGVPASASSYVLATRMGGDASLMASIITAQTVLAMATLTVLSGFL